MYDAHARPTSTSWVYLRGVHVHMFLLLANSLTGYSAQWLDSGASVRRRSWLHRLFNSGVFVEPTVHAFIFDSQHRVLSVSPSPNQIIATLFFSLSVIIRRTSDSNCSGGVRRQTRTGVDASCHGDFFVLQLNVEWSVLFVTLFLYYAKEKTQYSHDTNVPAPLKHVVCTCTSSLNPMQANKRHAFLTQQLELKAQ